VGGTRTTIYVILGILNLGKFRKKILGNCSFKIMNDNLLKGCPPPLGGLLSPLIATP